MYEKRGQEKKTHDFAAVTLWWRVLLGWSRGSPGMFLTRPLGMVSCFWLRYIKCWL